MVTGTFQDINDLWEMFEMLSDTDLDEEFEGKVFEVSHIVGVKYSY